MTITERDRMGFASSWVDAFNAADLPRILSHYASDVELVSPLYLRFTSERTDTVRGIGELEAYLGAALERYPDLRFKLLEVGVGSRTICVRYHTNLGDHVAMEVFTLNETGQALRVACHYVAADR